MVIVEKNIETKEIEIQGFRKILKDPKHPDYKELRIYIKNGWIPIDPEDDEKEMQKAKDRKRVLKEKKASRPSYKEMEDNLKKQVKNEKLNETVLDKFYVNKNVKNNYPKVLKWYKEILENMKKEAETQLESDKKASENNKN